MDITAVNRNVLSAPTQVPPVPVDHAAENREVVQAVKALNETEMFGRDNQLRFQRDPVTKRMVVQMVNSKTGEVVSQVPEEYLLRLAQGTKQSTP